MYKSIISLSWMVISFSVAVAQDTQVNQAAPVRKVSATPKPPGNFIKINLLGLPLRNFSFQYERVLSKRISLALGYRFMPSGPLPLLSTIESIAGSEDPSTKEALRSLNISNTAITPELRFYVGRKGYGRGFYLAPYYRYATFNVKGLKVELDNGNDNIVFSGKLTTQNIGFMLGAQWMISKRISLDWWIVGAQIGSHSSNLKGEKDIPLTDDERADIERFSKDITFPNLNLKTEFIDNNTASITTSGPWAGLRAGLCLGIRF
ncbi:MAG: DUF3575 domain-containing protein [Bacteroidota bacterium]|jgi:hypothetical protein